jgi:hypothetical protein
MHDGESDDSGATWNERLVDDFAQLDQENLPAV